MGRGRTRRQGTYLIDPLHRPVPLVVGARLNVRPKGFQTQRIRALGDRLSQAGHQLLALGVVHVGDRVVEGEVEEDLGPVEGHVGGRGGRQIGENRRGSVDKADIPAGHVAFRTLAGEWTDIFPYKRGFVEVVELYLVPQQTTRKQNIRGRNKRL